ncbi:hypothetical protein AMK16_09180 [Streptomyces sp. CB00455]|uniref:DUF4097 family beta strand repeat-containing protein n=1 Tax=Streptomyces sp. CB00455 TaxID=1703927 RepID=UPI00093BD7E1|nr:DUF4097 family beta strand repeat-containing protein [Streptomyces sp. CB00455]OKK20622.1 hypothetical protein AMK16_09180 [Streptomyces sp. CB00455]
MTSHAASLRPARTAVAVIAALGAGVLLAGCSSDGGSLGSALGDGPQKTLTADATVTEAVSAVEVTGARAGSIEINPGSGPGVTVHRTVHYREDAAPTPGQKVTGGVLTFSNGCSDTCYIDYRLEVPASATVRLESGSGRISVTGVAAAEVTAGSGAVKADRIAGPLTVRTSSGAITASGLGGPSADVHSDAGDARLDFAKVPASVLVDTTSGNVTLKVPQAPYRLEVSTSSGARDVSLPSDPAAASRLTVKTTSGDVRVSALGG